MAAWQNVKGVVIHHAVTPDPHDHDDCKSMAGGIERDHARDGYRLDDGSLETDQTHYNFLVCPHGQVVSGRKLGSTSDANGGPVSNREWVAVCFLGTNPVMTEAMEDRLRRIINLTEDKFNIMAHVEAHRNMPEASTYCPGPRMVRWAERYMREEVLAFTREEKEWLEKFAAQVVKHEIAPWHVRAAAQVRHAKEHTHEGGGAHSHEATVTLA